jgi:glycosyltransferase involved in cell wall biosynthesis
MKDELFLCVSPNHYRGIPVSKHHIARELSRRNTVIYVEPPIDVFSVLFRKERWYKLRAFSEPEKNLHLVSVVMPLKSERSARLLRMSRLHTSWLIDGLCKRLQRQPAVVWAFEPFAAHLIDRLPGRPFVVYHVTDEYEDLPGASRALVREAEGRMLERADLVVCVSRALADRRREVREDVRVVSNAVDVPSFQRSLMGRVGGIEAFVDFLRDAPVDVPSALTGLKRPILGVLGHLADFMDADLLKHVALEIPEASLALVGPTHGDRRIEALGELRNVHLLGRVPFEAVPRYIRAFDVCMIPFVLNRVTRDGSFLRLFEYLLCGKTVVSTDYPEAPARRLPFVRWAESTDDFVRKVRTALGEDRKTGLVERVRYAAENSWANRFREIEGMIAERAAGYRDS